MAQTKRDKPTGEEHGGDTGRDRGGFEAGMRWLGLGVEFMAVMGLFSYGGWKLDQHYGHRTPWLMIVGFAISFIGMTVLTIKEAKRLR